MKAWATILSVVIFCSCKSPFPEGSSKLIIDKSLKDSDFERFNWAAGESVIKTYIDSILVQTDSTPDKGTLMNADIEDLNKNHSRYNTCKAFFHDGSLIIDFMETFPSGDRLRLKITNGYYLAYILAGPMREAHLGFPKYLKINKKIKKPGQEILGKLAIDFFNPRTKTTISFQGMFKCVIEG
jgi:hypothetical protein